MTEVVMPQMGESITEGTLTKWLKQPGDTVERDEPLFEISTDKVDTEIPAPEAGTLAEVLVEEGATVEINTVVARIDGGNGAASAAPEAAKEKAAPTPAPAPEPVSVAAAPEPAAEPPSSLGPLSPLVRRMAREHNIDLAQVNGTGAGGRITKKDVEAYLASRPAAPEAIKPVPAAGPAKTRVEPMSNMRQKIAEHMVFSRQTSPHVTTVHRVDMTRVAKMRGALKNKFKELK
ncbi:MAG: hypothetical protein GY953_55300 [bacterium]|nr:hypothetical protein [bacterium]